MLGLSHGRQALSWGVRASLVVCGLSSPAVCGSLVPWPGIEPASAALEGGFFTTEGPGKSLNVISSFWTLRSFSSISKLHQLKFKLESYYIKMLILGNWYFMILSPIQEYSLFRSWFMFFKDFLIALSCLIPWDIYNFCLLQSLPSYQLLSAYCEYRKKSYWFLAYLFCIQLPS